MNRLRPVCLLLALLTGCVAPTPPPAAEEPNPFALPAGSPRNVRIGFVQGYPLGSPSVPVQLLPGTLAQERMVVVSRDPRLNPTAVLEITALRGRLAVARIVRGQPQPKDEVVLPSADLAERSRELAP
ncbi:MAG: hypothetical protein RJA95_914 [Verrucomicrobiota bacterium]